MFKACLFLGESQSMLANGLSVDTVLAPYVYVFYASFIVSFLFTPIMRTVASYYGVVDKPDGLRKMHREPIAYLGGVAVFLGWLAGLALSRFLVMHKLPGDGPEHIAPHIPLAIVAGAILIVILGLLDDIWGIKPRVKIAGQVVAALLLVFNHIGTKIAQPLAGNLNERLQVWLDGTTVNATVYVPEWLVYGLSLIMVVGLVVFCCNAANLMDGMDGLCGGVTAIISLGYVFLAIHLALGGVNSQNDSLRIIIALAMLGGVLGFVPFNFNPASIFMGDTGSMFLGFVIATMMLLIGEVASKWLLASLVMFALPTLDTCLAFVRRSVNGRSIFAADKHHIHHQFLARGLTIKQTVLFLYASSIGFVALGATVAIMRTRYAVAVYLVVFAFIVVAAFKIGMVHERVKTIAHRTPIGPDDTASSDQMEGVLELLDSATTAEGIGEAGDSGGSGGSGGTVEVARSTKRNGHASLGEVTQHTGTDRR